MELDPPQMNAPKCWRRSTGLGAEVASTSGLWTGTLILYEIARAIAHALVRVALAAALGRVRISFDLLGPGAHFAHLGPAFQDKIDRAVQSQNQGRQRQATEIFCSQAQSAAR